uniref:Transposase n=1 Tax=Steinernema glaseri TaxID=37863 RepID=A0A1I7ZII8_9BILA
MRSWGTTLTLVSGNKATVKSKTWNVTAQGDENGDSNGAREIGRHRFCKEPKKRWLIYIKQTYDPYSKLIVRRNATIVG